MRKSAAYSPSDARTYYHLGMALAARHKFAMRERLAHLLPPPAVVAEEIERAFCMAIRLESQCAAAGCKNGFNVAAAYLSLGEFMARLRNFKKGAEYLERVEDIVVSNGEEGEVWARPMLEEVSSILAYCRGELNKV